MSLTSWESRLHHWCMSMRRPSIIMDDLVELVRECIMENWCFTVTELICHFMQIFHSHLLFRKLCARWMPKQLTSEHGSKVHGVSTDISAIVSWWRWRVSGPDYHRWWNLGCSHYPRNQATVNALASQWISLQYEIQADFAGEESAVHGVLGQTRHSPDQRWDGECWALLQNTGHSEQAAWDA